MQIVINPSGRASARGTRGGARKNRNAGMGQIDVAVLPQRAIAHDKECACAGIQLDDQPEQSSSVLDALGIALLNRGCLEEGAKLIEQALRIRRKFFGDDHPLTAQSFNSYARVLRERGALNEAEQTSLAALRINRNAFQKNGYPVAVSLVELGVIYLNQGRHTKAEAAAAEGLAVLSRLGLDDTDPNTARLMDIRGRAEAARGDLSTARKTFEQILKLDREQGANLPKTASHLANLAEIKSSQGAFKEAESDYLKAIDVYANRLKRRCHPNLIDAYANLGSLYLTRDAKRSDLSAAAKYFKEALRLGLKVRGPAHVLVANDYANHGRLSYRRNKRREAIEHFSAALKIYDKNVRQGSIDSNYIYIAEVLTWLGRLLVEEETTSTASKAKSLLDRALKVWVRHGDVGRLGEAAASACLGRALYLLNKDLPRARKLLEQSYSVLRAASGKDHPFVAQIRDWLEDLSRCEIQAA